MLCSISRLTPVTFHWLVLSVCSVRHPYWVCQQGNKPAGANVWPLQHSSNREERGEEALSLYSPQVCSKIGDVVTHVTVDFIQAVRAVGRKENRVTWSLKWELDGGGITGHWVQLNWLCMAFTVWLNECLLWSFHQSAANTRVIQNDQHGPRVMIEVGECYSFT